MNPQTKPLPFGNIDPEQLIPNPWNVNVLSPEGEAKLDRSIERFGVFKPVVVRMLEDGSLQIIGGEHRAASAVRLGLPKIPFINMGAVDDQKAKEISLVDNQRYGHDDTLGLAELMEGLGSPEDLASFMPYTEGDIASIFSSVSIELDDLDIPDSDESSPSAPKEKPIQTHVVMRMKVPVGDAQNITDQLERVMKSQKFVDADSLTNVGDALVYVMSKSKF